MHHPISNHQLIGKEIAAGAALANTHKMQAML
jgi:hypothetical protein